MPRSNTRQRVALLLTGWSPHRKRFTCVEGRGRRHKNIPMLQRSLDSPRALRQLAAARKHTTLGNWHVAAGTSDGTTRGRTRAVPERDNVARATGPKNRGGGKGGREERVVVQGESAREREIERGRETERERIGEREGGRKHHTRFLGERIRSVGPVSRFVSDWCRVRGSRESTVRAARCVPLRPGGHVTRSPAGGRTAHSASKSGRPAMCVVYRARDSRARVGRIARVLEEEEKERERETERLRR